ncbi:MAG: hypothetical protein DCC43_00500 [Candidatus Brocadia sp.]|jgi:glycosyltransferase involved in cell wall biosynthesis|nr:N,N'-diacetylbacillosaminyl-diphospho-undecaprenol alpha-1,3-N-acetylgalactosaminyltransferase [Candidatus Brocadia fulgida]MCE7910182.1 glycosyltransferase family 1 protein [Candidatus Brocadia sp. AMX3]MDG5996855.1 glycosyltransferase family 1 protein [Candidatus Brocadia sp.]OQZ03147.1 MAG: hypothetical protein B6D35_00180 [Candidatus Brocadia sp. UTAMX2]RIK03307.1 MAG: hypothetical protein DCC43_00500 [Candidatus Brocadia sp.]
MINEDMKKKALFVANTGFALFNHRLQLMRLLSNAGWSVVAIANDESDYIHKFSKMGIKFINVNIDHKGMNPLTDAAIVWRLKSIYKHESPVLVHHFTIKPVIFGSLAAKWAKVPVIINSITGLGYAFYKGGFLMHTVMMLYKLALSGRPQVIFQNNDDCRLFISNNIVKKTKAKIILGSGIDTKTIYPNTKKRCDNAIQFLLVSRMLWSKGINEYVHAAEKVKKQFPGTRFIIAGGASGGGAKGNPDVIPEKWLRNFDAKGIIQWVGRIPMENVMTLLDNSDVIVLPSYYPEGVPRSLIEAAAKGKPIITTNTPGCKDVVVDGLNGFLMPPKNVELLANCMIKFIQDPGLIERMGLESRKRAIDLFDAEKILDKTVKVYKEAGAA